MGSLYKRGRIWWMAFNDATGKRQLRSTEKHDERNARQVLEEIEALVRSNAAVPVRAFSVAAWAKKWAEGRPQLDYGRLKKHVLPSIGGKLLRDVTQNDVRGLVIGWRDGKDLAPRTIRNIVWAMSKLFADAMLKGLLEKTPCVLVKGDRPKIRDKDRRWRQTAVFTRAEAEQLVTDPRVPGDRRTMWALGLLAGLRLGEVSALRWRDYDSLRSPLGCLHISSSFTRVNKVEKGTKTEVTRLVPAHPILAEQLASWRATGWAELFGRAPQPEDFVVPNRAGRHLNDQNVNESRKLDFATLQLRNRRFHDARRTMISLALGDGALPHVLKLVTHGQPAEVMDLYTTHTWATLCAAVNCLKFGPQENDQLQQPLRSQEEVLQPAETDDFTECPRRDSNPPTIERPDAVSRVSRDVGSTDSAARPHQPDALRSNVAARRRPWRTPAIRTFGSAREWLAAGGAA